MLPFLLPILIVGTIFIIKAFSEKKILIYGMKASGKSTFCNYCTRSIYSDFNANEEYRATLKIEDPKKLSDEWKEWVGTWNHWNLTDTPGQMVYNQDMFALKKAIDAADSVLYFCRADEIYNIDTRKKTLRTINANISQYKNELTKDGKKKLVFVITHYDKVIINNSADEIQIELNNDEDYDKIINNKIKPLCKGFLLVSLNSENISNSALSIVKSMVSEG